MITNLRRSTSRRWGRGCDDAEEMTSRAKTGGAPRRDPGAEAWTGMTSAAVPRPSPFAAFCHARVSGSEGITDFGRILKSFVVVGRSDCAVLFSKGTTKCLHARKGVAVDNNVIGAHHVDLGDAEASSELENSVLQWVLLILMGWCLRRVVTFSSFTPRFAGRLTTTTAFRNEVLVRDTLGDRVPIAQRVADPEPVLHCGSGAVGGWYRCQEGRAAGL